MLSEIPVAQFVLFVYNILVLPYSKQFSRS